MLLSVLCALCFIIPHAGAVLLGPDDTDDAARERAQAFPAVCIVDGECSRGSGVLIYKNDETAWILTAAHIVQNDDATDVRIKFSGYSYVTCQEIVSPPTGHRSFPSWEIKKDIALLRVDTKDWFPEALPLFDPRKNFLEYDAQWKIWRGEGHIVGYGWHGHDPNRLTADSKRRHVSTPFIVDVARDERDEGCGFWNIIACAPPLAAPTPLIARGTPASTEEGTFPTLISRCIHTQRMGFPIVDDQTDIAQYPPTIPERRIPFHGTTRCGDSGGPLLVTHKGQNYVLGICAEFLTEPRPCFQAYFTSVPHFTPWIHENIPALAPRTQEHHTTCALTSHVCEQAPPYVDPTFMYLLNKKSYTGRPTKPPVGIHVLSMSASHTL